MPSYNRYSHHARRALTHAGLLVTRYNHPGIDTGHLLVGMMLTEGSIAYRVLEDLDLSAAHAEPYLKTLYPTVETSAVMADSERSLNAVLQLAVDESTWLGQHYIGTEHLLLGITRTNEGNASALLNLLGVTPETVRRQVRYVIKDGVTEFNLQRTRRNARLSELSRRVINAAEQMSVGLDHPTVGLGHLLLVLLLEKRSLTSTLLAQSGLDEDRLRHDLSQRDSLLLVSIEEVLDEALEIAERLGDHYTGTDHLLLMLTLDPVGMELLRQYGVAPGRLRQRLEAALRRKR